MPVDESSYTACLDCKRGRNFARYAEDACSSGWQVRTRKMGCYGGPRIPGTKAKKGEQGYIPNNGLTGAGTASRGGAVGLEFEAKITPHILRNWDRERIVRFAKHLLGDECQECPKHNTHIDGRISPPKGAS